MEIYRMRSSTSKIHYLCFCVCSWRRNVLRIFIHFVVSMLAILFFFIFIFLPYLRYFWILFFRFISPDLGFLIIISLFCSKKRSYAILNTIFMKFYVNYLLVINSLTSHSLISLIESYTFHKCRNNISR